MYCEELSKRAAKRCLCRQPLRLVECSGYWQYINATIESHDHLFRCLRHPSMPVQIAFSILRCCALPRLSFLARTTHPKHFHSAAVRFDVKIIDCFRSIMRFGADTKLSNFPADPIHTQLTLPLQAVVFEFRPMERISHSAYFASLVEVHPEFIQAFPPGRCVEYTRTSVHAELEECRSFMLQQA
jgi:hypothetical protein